jgi:hypothetical protein
LLQKLIAVPNFLEFGKKRSRKHVQLQMLFSAALRRIHLSQKSSGKDFADHLKAGLEELGYHFLLDSKDIPKMVDGVVEKRQKSEIKLLKKARHSYLL